MPWMSYRQEANVTPEITACKINSYERSYIFEDAEESSEKGVCKAREMIQRDNIRMIEDTIHFLDLTNYLDLIVQSCKMSVVIMSHRLCY